jgi:cytochrome d ubiquinol oxidase subunit II
MNSLELTWYILIGVLFTVYAVLDGFDFGVGFWHLFSPREDRTTLLGVINPYWDGNEVWLLAGVGALFATFPKAYATVFSGFFPVIMLVLFALIFRAAADEFRNTCTGKLWNTLWDIVFSFGSILPPVLFGIVLGNILKGIPLDGNGDYSGTFLGLLNPFSLCVGFTGLAMFATHGLLFLALKTDGAIRERALRWAGISWKAYLVLFFLLTIWCIIILPHVSVNYWVNIKLVIVPVFVFVSVLAIPFLLKRGKPGYGFIASTVSILFLMATYGISMYPNLVFSLSG